MAMKPALSMDAGRKLELNWSSLSSWETEQLQDIIDYCHQRNWNIVKVSDHQSRALEPLLSIWKVSFSVRGKAKTVWFINGDLPIDFIPFINTQTARDALLCFSRKFLNQAQMLKQECLKEQGGEESKVLMKQLVKAAADLLVLYHEEKLWDKQ